MSRPDKFSETASEKIMFITPSVARQMRNMGWFFTFMPTEKILFAAMKVNDVGDLADASMVPFAKWDDESLQSKSFAVIGAKKAGTHSMGGVQWDMDVLECMSPSTSSMSTALSARTLGRFLQRHLGLGTGS